MRKSLIIFDFDGTIADTLEVAHQISNELSDEFGFPKISKHQLIELKGKSLREVLRMAGLSWLQLPQLVKRARERFKLHLDNVHPVNGMPETIEALHKRGYRMGIVTSNSKENVRKFLAQNEISHFEFIHAPKSIFGKARILKRIIKRYKLSPTELIMIGDEVRDLEAAAKAGIPSIAVSWGLNSEQILQHSSPQKLVRIPNELLGIFPPLLPA